MGLRNIAVMAGGFSGERSISMKSAETIMEALDSSRFRPFLIDVNENGWDAILDGERIPVDKGDFSLTLDGEHFPLEYAYIIIHGTPGEDGRLQCYLEMMNVPFSTGNTLSMATTFNKAQTQTLLKSKGLPVAEFEAYRFPEMPDVGDIQDLMSLPVFVKPTESGSSIGITKVKKAKDMEYAMKQAYAVHDEVMVEQFLDGREITCGVFRAGDRIGILPVTEVVSKNEYFDYEAKYNDDLNEEITPAPISDEIYSACQEMAALVYDILGCEGISRIDFFLVEDRLYIMEVNAVPGFSKESIVPKQIAEAGLSITTLLTDIIESGLE